MGADPLDQNINDILAHAKSHCPTAVKWALAYTLADFKSYAADETNLPTKITYKKLDGSTENDLKCAAAGGVTTITATPTTPTGSTITFDGKTSMSWKVTVGDPACDASSGFGISANPTAPTEYASRVY